MSDQLEDDLRRALGHASEGAPQAPGNLSAHVVNRSRRRRARAQALVAAAAVVVVAGGVGLAVRTTADGGPATTADPVRSPEPTITRTMTMQPSNPPPLVDEVWPDAVWRIPGKLPGLRKYQVRRFIDDRTVLLETWESFEKANAVYAYDLVSGDLRKIAAIDTPKGVFASGYAVGDGRLVWQTIAGGRSRFWSVPLSGGEPTEIRTDDPVQGRGDHLDVVGGKLAFSVSEGGVFTVPLEGGAVTPVEGAGRHHILRWPWVGTPGEYTPNGETSFEELLNVETGETSRAVVHPGEELVRCGVTMCTGIRDRKHGFYRLRDGTQEREAQMGFHGLGADRFYNVRLPHPLGGHALVDIQTGKSGDLGQRPDAKGESFSVHPGMGDGRLMAYPLKGQYVVIDLSKIAAG